jgi:hypothetical protein
MILVATQRITRIKDFDCLYLPDADPAKGAGSLAASRAGFYDCLTARADALFEPGDALLCHSGTLASLSPHRTVSTPKG